MGEGVGEMLKVKLSTQQNMDYKISEAYKTLRTNVQFSGEDVKVIAVTSCTPNEGKSTTSLNLAISLAEIGKKVMFIDADLRKSVIVNRYKVEGSIKGLSHYLSGQNTLEEVCYATNVSNLHVIFSGPFVPNPAELLGGKKFAALIPALRNVYDYVIIDTPPLGRVIDSAVISKCCDGAMMVISSGAISYKFAQTTKSQLEKSNVPILGVVMNKVPITRNSYYGKYYGYGNYGGYGENAENKAKK